MSRIADPTPRSPREPQPQLSLRTGDRVVIEPRYTGMTHGHVVSIDGDGIVHVALLGSAGAISLPLESVLTVCGHCADCACLNLLPACAETLNSLTGHR
jgi:hypothetical protein